MQTPTQQLNDAMKDLTLTPDHLTLIAKVMEMTQGRAPTPKQVDKRIKAALTDIERQARKAQIKSATENQSGLLE